MQIARVEVGLRVEEREEVRAAGDPRELGAGGVHLLAVAGEPRRPLAARLGVPGRRGRRCHQHDAAERPGIAAGELADPLAELRARRRGTRRQHEGIVGAEQQDGDLARARGAALAQLRDPLLRRAVADPEARHLRVPRERVGDEAREAGAVRAGLPVRIRAADDAGGDRVAEQRDAGQWRGRRRGEEQHRRGEQGARRPHA